MKAEGTLAIGAMLSGVLASACCIAPIGLALLGASGAAFASRFEPFRPYLLLMSYTLLAGAFFLARRSRVPSCSGEDGCVARRSSLPRPWPLWLAAVLVVLTSTYPWYAPYLFP